MDDGHRLVSFARCAGPALALIAALVTARSALSQSRPFPSAAHYVAGYTPSTVSSTDARKAYDSWKANYLKNDCGTGLYRVEFDSPAGTTVSEGQGYGMVLTAYFGDKTEFDGLWAFAQKNFDTEARA